MPGSLFFGMSSVPRTVDALVKKSGLAMHEVDPFVFHEASKKVPDNTMRLLDILEEKAFR